jgi:predicted nucleic acid-binding protein
VLLEGKTAGLVDRIEPLLDEIARAGLWMSSQIRQRILILAGEVEK